MMPNRHPFSAFAPENTQLLRENPYNYIRIDSLNPPFHYPRTHDSNIPEFQHPNWGEALNLCNLYKEQFSNLISKSEKRWGGNSETFYDYFNKSQLFINCQSEFNRFKLYMK